MLAAAKYIGPSLRLAQGQDDNLNLGSRTTGRDTKQRQEVFRVMRKYHFLIALCVIALDRVTKWTVAHRLSLHDSIPVIPGFFRIIHAENPGAAFGIFADSPSEWIVGLLILFSLIALLIVSALLWKNSHSLTSTGIGLSLILGGAVGNLWDRLVSAIVVGAGLLVFEIVFTKSPSRQSA